LINGCSYHFFISEKSKIQLLNIGFVVFLLNFNRTFAAEKSTLNSHYTHMDSVRPDEISAILRQQLAGTQTEAELEEVGTVLQIGDGVARIYGLSKVQAGELLSFDNGLQAMALNLEEDNVGAVLLGDYSESRKAIPLSAPIRLPMLTLEMVSLVG
jgi:hypothetical protein